DLIVTGVQTCALPILRILGEITPERVQRLQDADDIFIRSLKENDLYDKVWQAATILLPINTVGVMGDERTYENVVCLRAVTSVRSEERRVGKECMLWM